MKLSRRCPGDFEVTNSMKTWARQKVPGVDIESETEMLMDHEFAKAKKDWPATWRNWMRREQKTINKVQSNRDFYAGKIQKPVTQEQTHKQIEDIRSFMELPLDMSAEDVLTANQRRIDGLLN